jgi:hypothetical protein
MSKNKKSWPKIGTLRKGETGSYIKLEDNVTILVDGEPISLNKTKTIQLQDPRAKLEQMFEKGYINEKDYDRRRETLAENQWLRYELVAPPNKDV